MISLTVNGQTRDVDVVGLTGTTFGCGVALCGCCTMHIDGQPMRTSILPASYASGKKITTIENARS
ncbi:MAG TPA: hypothetical protein VFE36_11065 [Candidatus Baltobacteraceae bacterium]|nr:hypothetical protein [Candidatus Baltobacteraceae bacterium]